MSMQNDPHVRFLLSCQAASEELRKAVRNEFTARDAAVLDVLQCQHSPALEHDPALAAAMLNLAVVMGPLEKDEVEEEI